MLLKTQMLSYGNYCIAVDEPPRINDHPESLIDVRPGQPVSFTVHATGTEPLNFQWQWKRAGSKEWQPCDVDGSGGAEVTIPSVQNSDEGQYRCVVKNNAGSQISKPAKLEVSEVWLCRHAWVLWWSVNLDVRVPTSGKTPARFCMRDEVPLPI